MPPTADLVLAGLLGLGTYGAAEESAGGEAQTLLLLGGVAVGLLGSAVYGWQKTDACRTAKEVLSARLNDFGSPNMANVPAGQIVDPWLAGGPLPPPPPAAPSGRPTPPAEPAGAEPLEPSASPVQAPTPPSKPTAP